MENNTGVSLLLPTSEVVKAVTGSSATFGLHQHQRGTASKINLACVPKKSLFFLYYHASWTCRIILTLKGSCPRVLNQAFCIGREVTSCSLCHFSIIFNQSFAGVISLLKLAGVEWRGQVAFENTWKGNGLISSGSTVHQEPLSHTGLYLDPWCLNSSV